MLVHLVELLQRRLDGIDRQTFWVCTRIGHFGATFAAVDLGLLCRSAVIGSRCWMWECCDVIVVTIACLHTRRHFRAMRTLTVTLSVSICSLFWTQAPNHGPCWTMVFQACVSKCSPKLWRSYTHTPEEADLTWEALHRIFQLHQPTRIRTSLIRATEVLEIKVFMHIS